MDINAAFQWKCYPKVEALIIDLLAEVFHRNSAAALLSERLLKHTSTRLFDWLDYIQIGYSEKFENEILEEGYTLSSATSSYRLFSHPGAQLPRIVISDDNTKELGIAVLVDQISDFLSVRGLSRDIDGSSFSSYRRSLISNENNSSFWVVERRGTFSIEPKSEDKNYLENYFKAKEKWKTRSRDILDEEKALFEAIKIAEELVFQLGQSLAASIVLECEREYWQMRNSAGQIQKYRQDRLGMGWANHDHHTFRSSRKNFVHLVRLFETLGFHCRERFYAGAEAGWGAQVMENSVSRLVLFLDVDLHKDELSIDFAHHPLKELEHLGTIGLWCSLHGDSILKSGMHHLEAQFMFEELKGDLLNAGVGMMEPFSSFHYLKQAFTNGEVWPVDKQRIQNLVDKGVITKEQAEKFASYGAIGSHLENLQRREGYKGFNQKNVSIIIEKTDPRSL